MERWQAVWVFEPWVIGPLLGSAVWYAWGVFVLWTHAAIGHGIAARHAAAFLAGWLALVVALVSPLDSLSESLFSAHMVQHELLMLVAAPLFVVARPLAAWAWALPPAWRRTLGRVFHAPLWRAPWLVITGPIAAWWIHAIALWVWHVPTLFEAALDNEVVHTAQHITFLFAALLFWWSVLRASSRGSRGIAVLSLFTTMAQTGALGALLTLASRSWYPSYAVTTTVFGLTAVEDQQLGGLVMWVPTGFVYLGCGLVIGARWLNDPNRRR